jgi:hypothetical protein
MLFWIRQFFSNREFHKRAFEEVFVVAMVSIFPLVLLPFLSSAKASADTPFALGPTLWKAIESGQLYLYSFALFGTLIWLCVEDVSSKQFPPRKYFVLASILSAFLCVLVYGLDPENQALKPCIGANKHLYISNLSAYVLRSTCIQNVARSWRR